MKVFRKKIKESYIFIAVLIVVCIGFLFPFFQPGFYLSHDGEAQVVRITAFYKSIMDGQIPPRWAGDLNYGYGLPTLNFFFPLEGYIGTVIRLFGFSLQDVFKLEMAGSFILAPVMFFLWASKIFKKEIAFAGAAFYGFAPYHFLDMYVRGQLAEMLAFVFVPLVLFFVERNLQKRQMSNIIGGGLCLMLLILSHSVLSLLFTGIISLYILVRTYKQKKDFLSTGSIVLFGLLSAIFFWLPALYEGRYINSKLFVGEVYTDHFVTLQQLFYSPWGFGADVNILGGLSPQIGVLHVILALLSIVVIVRQKEKLVPTFWFIIFVATVFMSTKFSQVIWENIHTVQQFQFPWRFVAVSSFVASVLVMYTFILLKRKVIIFLIVFVLFLSSLQFVQVESRVNKGDSFYLNYPGAAAYHGEATTIWTEGDASSFPKQPLELIGGKATITNFTEKSNLHSFTIKAQTPAQILDNTVYFPGWEVMVDGQNVPIEFQDANHRGLITFRLPQGTHDVQVQFKESKVRLIADILSLTMFAFVAIFFIITLLYNKQNITHDK